MKFVYAEVEIRNLVEIVHLCLDDGTVPPQFHGGMNKAAELWEGLADMVSKNEIDPAAALACVTISFQLLDDYGFPSPLPKDYKFDYGPLVDEVCAILDEAGELDGLIQHALH